MAITGPLEIRSEVKKLMIDINKMLYVLHLMLLSTEIYDFKDETKVQMARLKVAGTEASKISKDIAMLRSTLNKTFKIYANRDDVEVIRKKVNSVLRSARYELKLVGLNEYKRK